jgi:7-cyano-7-deazaguanine synthase
MTAAARAIVLLSGGLDSSTTLAVAKEEGYELYALSFDYRQRHDIELESAKRVALSLGVKKHLIIKIDLRQIGGSALTADIEVPKSGAEGERREETSERIPVTYVPARNTVFLSFALGWAEVLEAGDIFIGANAVDYSGYPDCRPEYLQAYEDMANLATRASVEGKLRFRIRAPLVTLKKSEIIRKGAALGLDYSLTWSCYDPQPGEGSGTEAAHAEKRVDSSHLSLHSSLIPCGRCDSCRLRAKGFAEAGLEDPLLKQAHFNADRSLL